MQKIYIILCIVTLILLAQCAPQAKMEYDIPQNMTEQQKNDLRIQLDRAVQMYKTSCSKCHGIFTKGKDKIPNFSTQQITNYKSRREMRDSGNHAFAMNMPPEDLDAILYLLMIRKKTGAATDSVHK